MERVSERGVSLCESERERGMSLCKSERERGVRMDRNKRLGLILKKNPIRNRVLETRFPGGFHGLVASTWMNQSHTNRCLKGQNINRVCEGFSQFAPIPMGLVCDRML